MDDKPLDRSLFIPVAIGAVAVIGICFVLLALRLGSAPARIESTATATPLKYVYLGTEPAIVLPTELPSPTLEATMTPIVFSEGGGNRSTPTATVIVVRTATSSPTFQSAGSTITATEGPTTVTYDDTNSRLIYTGNWVGQSGLSTVDQNTLHISSTIGDAVLFNFYGENFYIRYQAGPSLGAIAIKIDTTINEVVNSSAYTLDQSSASTGGGEWDAPTLTTDWHTVTITHISGGSINIDSVIVVTFATPTPTVTPTATAFP